MLGYDEDPSSEDDDLANDDIEVDGNYSASDRANDEDDDDNIRDWGTSKADYYNADLVETEADALDEEKEARRLHQKHVQNLTEADFGIDENQRTLEDTAGNELWRDTFTERLPELEVAEDASTEEKTRILKNRYPEFEPLAKDFVELQKVHDDLYLAAKATEAIFAMKRPHRTSKTGEGMDDTLMNKAPVATTKLRALSTYLGTVGMYFALLTSTAKSGSSTGLAMSPSELRDHPVVQSLLRARLLWDKAKKIAIPELRDIAKEAEAGAKAEIRPSPHLNETSTASVTNGTAGRKKKQSSKAERAAVKAQELAEAERQVRMQRTEDKLAELDALVSTKRKDLGHRSMQTTGNGGGGDSDIGDEEALTAHEAAEKAQRKKSLRFYTSQIAQKSNKRGAASRDAGGDADLPYKERLKDRQARLMREAERRGRSEAGQDERLGSEGSGDDAQDVLMAKEFRGDDHDDETYYDMVSARTTQKKAEKKAFAEAQAQAAAEGGQVYVEEEVGPDGKRAITYAIAKNKGLAPRRKKEVRNPRVKKKMQFSQKMKKLGSIRQVYRGGEGKGGYGGELTGIKTNVLKGVRL